jgi:hypothetical protein
MPHKENLPVNFLSHYLGKNTPEPLTNATIQDVAVTIQLKTDCVLSF